MDGKTHLLFQHEAWTSTSLRMLVRARSKCTCMNQTISPHPKRIISTARPTLQAKLACSKMSACVEEDHYATAANFGGDVYVQEEERSPFVKKVTVPESIKRRVPSKHYVSPHSCTYSC